MPKSKHNDFVEDLPRARPIETVPIAEITTDLMVQPRAKLNPSVVAEYADRMSDGVEFPPLVVVMSNGRYLLADGYIRFEAAKIAQVETMRCEVHRGDLRLALLLASAANASHGLPRTWDDRRRAVHRLLSDPEWTTWSDREIARRCSVSHGFVGQLRSQVTGRVTSERQFVNKHGTVSTMNVTALASRPTPKITSSADTTSRAPTSADVVSLSGSIRDRRSEVVAALTRIESEFDQMPPVSTMGRNVGGDAALAARWAAIARRAAAFSEHLKDEGEVRAGRF